MNVNETKRSLKCVKGYELQDLVKDIAHSYEIDEQIQFILEPFVQCLQTAIIYTANKKCGSECEPHFPKQTTKPVNKISLQLVEI